MAWKNYFLSASVLCAGVSVYLVISNVTWTDVVKGLPLFIISAICLHIWSLKPARNMSLAGVLQLYVLFQSTRLLGNIFMFRFKTACKDVKATQLRTLMSLIKRCKTTIFGSEHNMADIKTITDFQSRMRLTTYADYKPYVDRILDGERNILFPEEVNFFGLTSGTTSGQSKAFPVNTYANEKQLFPPSAMVLANILRGEPEANCIRYSQTILVRFRTGLTERGVKKAPMSTLFWGVIFRMAPHSCTPIEIAEVYEEDIAYYIHLVFVLREKEILSLSILTSAILFKVLAIMENKWKVLLRDIREGTIDPKLDIENHLRSAFERRLTPRPERADELSAIFENGFKHVVPKIWPHLKGIFGMTTGSLAVQTQIVRDTYIGPEVPLFSTTHGGTEGIYGMSAFEKGLRCPETGHVIDDFIILPNIVFYEFIPVDKIDEDQPQTLLAHQVTVGLEYELVITNTRGLFRYRTGDVVRISGYLGNTPKYKFLQRTGDILNANSEKLAEVVFRQAMTETVKEWTSVQLTNYVVTENVHVDRISGTVNSKLFYFVFVETKDDEPVPPSAGVALDSHLYRISDAYQVHRQSNIISTPQFVHVARGTFDLVRDFAAARNPNLCPMQYKHPLIIRNQDKLKIILQNQLGTCSSSLLSQVES